MVAMDGKSPQILVVTGSRQDDWLMHHVFLPVAKWLTKMSGRSAQDWAKVFLVGGVVAIVASNLTLGGGVTYAVDAFSDLIWMLAVRQLWEKLNQLEKFSDSGDAMPFYVVTLCRHLISMRTITAFLTIFNLIMVPVGGEVWWLALLGTALMTLACFLATTFPPRGKSLKERVKSLLRAPMRLSLAPPVPA
jgi:hypothetical protein